MSLKICYGPYEAHGVIKHRSPKLYGIIEKFIDLGYQLKVIPTNRLNSLVIYFGDKEIYRCDLRYLLFNIDFDDDLKAQNLVRSVKETVNSFTAPGNILEFEPTGELLPCETGGVSHHWTYENQDKWPSSCQGNLQSPIALSFNDVYYIRYKRINFDENSWDQKKAYLRNNGHTVEIGMLNKADAPTISGGGLPGKYIFSSMHFHWPAEHTIRGYRYPLEAHFVYYAENYKSFETAMLFKDGIAVMAVLYKETKYNNPAFNFVLEVPLVKESINSKINLTCTFIQKKFFPKDTDKYFRYNGSLTTPNCNEIILWTVFAHPSYISEEQLKILSTIYDAGGKRVITNNRDMQNRNARSIYLVF